MILFQSSAEITSWPERLALTLLFFSLIGLIYFGMYSSWKGKSRRDSEIPSLVGINQRIPLHTYSGRYISTTYADDWLKRVHAQGLALPSNATLAFFSDGIGFILTNTEFFIPGEDIVNMQSASALAGKVFEKDGLVCLRWRLGKIEVVTGFRAASTHAHIEILERGARIG